MQSAQSAGGNGCRAGGSAAGDAQGVGERNPAGFEAGAFGDSADEADEADERWTHRLKQRVEEMNYGGA